MDNAASVVKAKNCALPSPSPASQELAPASEDSAQVSQDSAQASEDTVHGSPLCGEWDELSDDQGPPAPEAALPVPETFSDAEGDADDVVDETPAESLQPEQDTADSTTPIFDAKELLKPFTEDSAFTRGDAYTMLLDVAIRFGLSWTAIEAVQKLFNNLMGQKAFPESKYLLKKFCGVDLSDLVFHFYCEQCMALLAKAKGSVEERQQLQVTCVQCGKEYVGRELVRSGSFFVGLPFRKQLGSVLSSKTVSEAVATTLDKASHGFGSSGMNDITDGHHYRSLRDQGGIASTDLTLSLNSDGSPVFKSSTYSIWPVQAILNELPPLLRWANVMMPFLWYGKSHPDMTLLLQAFVDEIEDLNRTGVIWTSTSGCVHSKVFCICCCADAPARAAMQNVKQYNGFYGCSWCYHPGTKVEGIVKYCIDQPYPDRTDDEAVQDMTTAYNKDQTIRGVKGPCPLINLHGFSAVWSWCPDYMHCVLLGVTRQMADIWFSDRLHQPKSSKESDESGPGFYIGTKSQLDFLDERLCAIRMPECFNRQPRSLLGRSNWKASEWQCWLLYYSVPCLSGVLDQTYLDHWSLFVAGVYLLLKDSVTKSDIEKSTRLLTEFVVGIQFLYHDKEMTYNVHQLLHLPKSVLLFGPLWAHSCFTFETNIGRLQKLVTSANGVALQIATRLLLQISFSAMKASVSDNALALMGKKKIPTGNLVPLGKTEKVEGTLVSQHVELQGSEVVEFRRLSVSGAIICSSKYERHLRVDSRAVLLPGGVRTKAERIFRARELSGKERFFILAHKYSTTPLQPCAHISEAHHTKRLRLYEIDHNARPCVYLSIAGRDFFCDLVNSYQWS